MSNINNDPTPLFSHSYNLQFNQPNPLNQEPSEIATPSYAILKNKIYTQLHNNPQSDLVCINTQLDDKPKNLPKSSKTLPTDLRVQIAVESHLQDENLPKQFIGRKNFKNCTFVPDSCNINKQFDVQLSIPEKIKEMIKQKYIVQMKQSLMKFSSAEKRLGDKINVLNKAFSGENEIENTGRDLLLLERMWILIILIILYFILIWPEFKGQVYIQIILNICLSLSIISNSVDCYSHLLGIGLQIAGIILEQYKIGIGIKYILAFYQLIILNKFWVFSYPSKYFKALKLIFNIFISHYICASMLISFYQIDQVTVQYQQVFISIAFLQPDPNYYCFYYLLFLFYIYNIYYQIANVSSNIQNQSNIVNTYLARNKASENIKIKVNSLFQKAINFQYVEDGIQIAKSLELLPSSLRNDLMVDIRYKVLTQQKIFKNNFTNQILKNLAALIQEVHIAPEKIFNTNQDMAFIILEGQIQFNILYGKNRIIELGILGPGDLYGQQELFKPTQRHIQIKAKQFCRILIISRDSFRQSLQSNKKDEERYCMIRDHILEGYDEQKLHYKCLLCLKHHFSLECPMIQYKPNKERVILKYLFQENQQRGIQKRFDRKRINSRMIMDRLKDFIKDFQDAMSFTQQHSDMVSEYINQFYSSSNINQAPQNDSLDDSNIKQSDKSIINIATDQLKQTSQLSSSKIIIDEDYIEPEIQITQLQRAANTKSTNATASFNNKLGFNNQESNSSGVGGVTLDFRSNNRRTTNKDYKEEMMLLVQNQQLIYTNQPSLNNLPQQGSPNQKGDNISKSISASQSQVSRNNPSYSIINYQQNQQANEREQGISQYQSIQSNDLQQPSSIHQTQIIQRTANPKLTFQFESSSQIVANQPTYTNQYSQSQSQNQQQDRTQTKRSQSYSQSQFRNERTSSYYTSKSKVGTRTPSIMNHLDDKMPSSIVPNSSGNLPVIEDDGGDNFKYVSSQNALGERRDRKIRTKSRSRSDLNTSNINQSDQNDNSRTLKLKGELDYLSKERKIVTFEQKKCFEFYFKRYNYPEVILRYNNRKPKKVELKNSFSFFYMQTLRGQKIREGFNRILKQI